MAIKTQCPHCNQEYTLAATMGGKRVRCKGCSEAFLVQSSLPEEVPEVVPVEVQPPPLQGRDNRRSSPYDDRDDDERGRRYREDDRDDYDRGRPRRRRPSGIPVWVWFAGGGGLLLVLLLGTMVLLFATGALGSRVTAQNYAKLQHGMTEAEVIAILGRPTEDPNTVFRNNPAVVNLGMLNFRVLGWRSGSSQIVVGFTNDRVTMLSGTNLR